LHGRGALATLISFDGGNGSQPHASLVPGGDGNFYGTTSLGGSNDLGTIFRVSPAGLLSTLLEHPTGFRRLAE